MKIFCMRFYNPREYMRDSQFRETARRRLFQAASVSVLAFAGSWALVPLYQLVCGAQGGGVAKREGIASHKTTAPETVAEKAKQRLIRVEFASSVQGRLKWDFRPEQKFIYVTPGETALASREVPV